jgi:hypothetical protein
MGAIIRRTSIAAGRESSKATAGSIKRAPRRHAEARGQTCSGTMSAKTPPPQVQGAT